MLVVGGVLAVLALISIFIYNRMVSGKNAVKAGFANIDVELKRRFDLIPNLVETAKKYMDHESSTLLAVTLARNDAVSAIAALRKNPFSEKAVQNMSRTEAKLTETIASFRAVAESYPNLKADSTMLKLMGELADTENRIAFMRQNYNDIVMNYNNSLEVFPNVFFARMFNFTAGQSWQIQKEEEREAVKIVF